MRFEMHQKTYNSNATHIQLGKMKQKRCTEYETKQKPHQQAKQVILWRKKKINQQFLLLWFEMVMSTLSLDHMCKCVLAVAAKPARSLLAIIRRLRQPHSLPLPPPSPPLACKLNWILWRFGLLLSCQWFLFHHFACVSFSFHFASLLGHLFIFVEKNFRTHARDFARQASRCDGSIYYTAISNDKFSSEKQQPSSLFHLSVRSYFFFCRFSWLWFIIRILVLWFLNCWWF